jgi:hypothetical protein
MQQETVSTADGSAQINSTPNALPPTLKQALSPIPPIDGGNPPSAFPESAPQNVVHESDQLTPSRPQSSPSQALADSNGEIPPFISPVSLFFESISHLNLLTEPPSTSPAPLSNNTRGPFEYPHPLPSENLSATLYPFVMHSHLHKYICQGKHTHT